MKILFAMAAAKRQGAEILFSSGVQLAGDFFVSISRTRRTFATENFAEFVRRRIPLRMIASVIS